MHIREEAFPFAAPPWVLAAAFGAGGFLWPSLLAALAGLFVLWFFRDPDREPPPGCDLIVSPADGRILLAEAKGGALKISVFMSVFSVHVNRAPVSGTVEEVRYNPGLFLSAFKEKASLENEQNRIRIRSERGPVDVVQIAGLIARRILCWVAPGEQVRSGERVGLIRFGSRVDLHLPSAEAEPLVSKGQAVRAGSTPVARWRTP